MNAEKIKLAIQNLKNVLAKEDLGVAQREKVNQEIKRLEEDLELGDIDSVS